MADYDFESGIDTLDEILLLQLKDGTARNVTSSDIQLFWTGQDGGTKTALFTRRDITTIAKASGVNTDTDNGHIGLPSFDGRTLPSDSSGVVTVTNGKVEVTYPAGGGGTNTQELYMSKEGETTPLYKVAEWDDGDATTGLEVGIDLTFLGPTDLADASLHQLAPTANRSQTEGHDAIDDPTTAPTVVDVPGGDAGTITAGDHVFAIVNRAKPDTWQKRVIEFCVETFNRVTGKLRRYPKRGWLSWSVGGGQ